jgi:uncharacterized protein (DUF1015 family)
MTSLVRPFRALRPRPERAADVIAPPYDVVSTEEARALAATKPASFLHISRPEIDLPPGTSPYSDDAYARGAASLARLVDTNVLVRDDEPGYYVYRIEMQGACRPASRSPRPSRPMRRTGFAVTSTRGPTKRTTACGTSIL